MHRLLLDLRHRVARGVARGPRQTHPSVVTHDDEKNDTESEHDLLAEF